MKGVVLDEVLVSVLKPPLLHWENVVEISCHGSKYIQEEVLRLFISIEDGGMTCQTR